jgi:hypothetical protein
MSQYRRLVLAAFCCFLVLPLTGSDVSAESDGGAMARAALPPPPKSAQSRADRYQPPQPQTLGARRDSTASGPGIIEPRSPNNHTSRHRRREIPAAEPARGEKTLGRQTVSSLRHDQAYVGPGYARPPEPPVALPPPPFGYNPMAPPGYGYPSIYQPPWLPGPTPSR